MVESRTKKMAYDEWLRAVREDLEEWIRDEGDEKIRQLFELREFVLKNRGDDITAELYFYDARVFLSEISEDIRYYSNDNPSESDDYSPPIGWETIRRFPYIGPDGKESYYELDKRKVKLCFLRGWLEFAQWEKKSTDFAPESPHFLLPATLEEAGVEKDAMDHFILGESASLSHDIMRKTWIWLEQNPKSRKKKARFIDKKQMKHSHESLRVFVPSSLWELYYGRSEKKGDRKNNAGEEKKEDRKKHRRISQNTNDSSRLGNVESRLFLPAKGIWLTIQFSLKTESHQFAMANVIAWHEKYYAQMSKGDLMHENHDIQKNNKTKIENDEGKGRFLSSEIKRIQRKEAFSTEELSESEKETLRLAGEVCPEVKRNNYRSQVQRKLRFSMRESLARSERKSTGFRFGGRKIYHITSRLWNPEESEGESGFWNSLKRIIRRPLILSTALALFLGVVITPALWNRSAPDFEQLVLTGITQDGRTFQVGPSIRTRGKTADDLILKSGDYLSIYFVMKEDAFVAAYLLSSQGEYLELFSDEVTAGQEVRLPKTGLEPTLGYRLDNIPGDETVLLIAFDDDMDKKLFGKKLSEGIEQLRRAGIDKAKEIFPNARIEMLRFRHE